MNTRLTTPAPGLPSNRTLAHTLIVLMDGARNQLRTLQAYPRFCPWAVAEPFYFANGLCKNSPFLRATDSRERKEKDAAASPAETMQQEGLGLDSASA